MVKGVFHMGLDYTGEAKRKYIEQKSQVQMLA